MMWNELTVLEQKNLQQLLQQAEGRAFNINQSFRTTYWFANDAMLSEFRMTIVLNKLIVSRVMFQNQRRGTMTKVFQQLLSICDAHGLSEIVIQSVLTDAMASWCLKNGFHPDPGASYETEDGVRGDYIMYLYGEKQ